ncbi:hypothetical protein DVH24_003292 [Malus domestica]|uniref:Zinc knuckle CX2CX4HX4C domain-containing protein n=1 Tax=Malus domestica TaxID=3750 RepID=A0A498IKW2_MALDO|nr:hypothetical protein DVH24_003292 [Malus domestica]
MLAEVKGLDVPANVPLHEQGFWIQIHGLPPSLMSVRMEETLSVAIGRVVRVDYDSSGSCVGEFLQIRVGIDVSLQLKRGLQVRLCDADEGTLVGVLLQYERLPAFCFLCGFLDHKGVHCPNYNGGSIHDFRTPYSIWLRVGGYSRIGVRVSTCSALEDEGVHDAMEDTGLWTDQGGVDNGVGVGPHLVLGGLVSLGDSLHVFEPVPLVLARGGGDFAWCLP